MSIAAQAVSAPPANAAGLFPPADPPGPRPDPISGLRPDFRSALAGKTSASSTGPATTRVIF